LSYILIKIKVIQRLQVNFKKISEAYETLGDTDKKKEYDMRRNNPFIKMMQGHGTGPNSGNGMNPVDEMFSNLFGMQFGHMPSFGPGMQFAPNLRVYHNGVPINVQGFSQGMQKPTPIIKNIAVSIDKILTGTTVPIDIDRWIVQEGHKLFEHETLYVQIPKGADEGEIIILREKGNISSENCKGDIKIFVSIENNTEFKRQGTDLIFSKRISLKEALCGFVFEINHLNGKRLALNNINNPTVVKPNFKKLVQGMGMTRDNSVGNLIIEFDIDFPETLTANQIEGLNTFL
jgi:DnaJ family protein B protein 4